MATSADVPEIYDVVIDGKGYMLARVQDVKAELTYTPTFVPRSNIQGDYGDNMQDFWMTATQRDWSAGEQQRYFRQDGTGGRRYWHGTNLDVTIPGQVSLRQTFPSIGFAAAALCCAPLDVTRTIFATATNAYAVSDDGSVTDLGAHSLGSSPTTILGDGNHLYLSAGGLSGAVGVRKYDGGSWSTWSAQPISFLAYVNNTLYGLATNITVGNTSLILYDTAGTSTSCFTWSAPDGGAFNGYQRGCITGHGGKVMVGLNSYHGAQVWEYAGSGASIVAQLPRNFYVNSMTSSTGILWMAGIHLTAAGYVRPALYFFVGGTVGLLWRADTPSSTAYTSSQIALNQTINTAVATFDQGVVFNDDTLGQLMYWDAAYGGVSSIGSYTVAGNTVELAATSKHVLMTRNQTTGYQFPGPSYATSGTVISSLYDFDSSLQKRFHGLIVEWAAGTDGNGGTVDIAYQVDGVDGSWTTLQTSAVSGTEYTLSGVTGRSIAIRVTLNKGTSTKGPTLKHWYVRASPIKSRYRKARYVLDLTGRDGRTPVMLRNGAPHPKDGAAMLADLTTSMASSAPVSITDPLSTYNGVFDADETTFRCVNGNDEYIAVVSVREV